ncbi:MAG: hypothetical protein GAK34_03913 [Delftia tsuruhatensis]|nr:MAG: hypothetical protein GAK34_03913 [Delftia tsuruhatensis]
MRQRRAVQVQHVELVLVEVADGQAARGTAFAGLHRQFFGQRLDQRALAGAVGAQHAHAAACAHHQRHVAQDRHGVARRIGIACGKVFQRQQGIGNLVGRRDADVDAGFGLQRRQHLHAGQRLDAALRLLGLGGLGLEAVDEFLQVGDLFLLALERSLLQQHLLGAQFLELAVVAAIARDLRVFDVQRGVGDGVQEFAVMADHDQGAGVALEPGFQPDQGVQVQVVGGLVQQQQVGGAHQRARQLQAHAPAAGEAVDGVLQLGDLEAQAQDQGLCARHGVVRAGIGQVHVGVGNGHAVLAGLGGRELGVELAQARVAVQHELGGRLRGLGHVLRDLAQAPLRRDGELSTVLGQAAVEQGEQAGLAGAVASDKADFFTGVDGDGGAVQQHAGAAAQGNVAKADHEWAGLSQRLRQGRIAARHARARPRCKALVPVPRSAVCPRAASWTG